MTFDIRLSHGSIPDIPVLIENARAASTAALALLSPPPNHLRHFSPPFENRPGNTSNLQFG